MIYQISLLSRVSTVSAWSRATADICLSEARRSARVMDVTLALVEAAAAEASEPLRCCDSVLCTLRPLPLLEKNPTHSEWNYFLRAINTGLSAHLHFACCRVAAGRCVCVCVLLQRIKRRLFSPLKPEARCPSVPTARRRFTLVRFLLPLLPSTCF